MKPWLRLVLWPLAFVAATFYSCYEVFWWAVIEEKSSWTRNLKNPIQSFAEAFRSPPPRRNA
jgi:hypothetical protein